MDFLKWLKQSVLSPVASKVQQFLNPVPFNAQSQIKLPILGLQPSGSYVASTQNLQPAPKINVPDTGYIRKVPAPTTPLTPPPVTTTTPTATTPTGPSTIEVITNSLQKMYDDIKKRGEEFDAKNPFSLDQLLAQKRTEVAARLDPYYTQTLEDYVRGVNLKRSRSLQDERQLITDIGSDVEHYTGEQKVALTEALDKSAQGLADVGLLTSGVGQREQGQLTAGTQMTLADYMRNAQRQQQRGLLTEQRTRENLGIEEALKKRDIAREQYATTESQALNEARIAELRRQEERNQYIGAPYSSSSYSNLAKYFANI